MFSDVQMIWHARVLENLYFISTVIFSMIINMILFLLTADLKNHFFYVFFMCVPSGLTVSSLKLWEWLLQ